MAAKMGIPTIAHESNARPGLAIKQLQGSLDRILVNFKDTEKYIKNKEKVMHVGNPIRGGFGGLDYAEARKMLGIKEDEIYVLAFGGSLGAQRMNEIVFSYMNNHARNESKVICHLATGRIYYSEFSKMYKNAGLDECSNLSMMEYIHDMHIRMSAADIIICRAGAMTISELAMMKKASIIIPSPNVVDNHQYKNAKVLEDANATVLIEEKDLDDKTFADAVNTLVADKSKREELARNIVQFANTDANKMIYDEIIKLTK